jgi:hypothetical protein
MRHGAAQGVSRAYGSPARLDQNEKNPRIDFARLGEVPATLLILPLSLRHFRCHWEGKSLPPLISPPPPEKSFTATLPVDYGISDSVGQQRVIDGTFRCSTGRVGAASSCLVVILGA